MACAQFRFYEELNDFLPTDQQKVNFEMEFERRASIKDMIESIGIPHTEVELILINGQSVSFSYILKDGDRVSVYPVFESFDISPLLKLRLRPLRRTLFVVDTNLGRLARYLRLLGFDTLYRNDYKDTKLAEISASEQRILLTRDRRLLMRSIITHGYFVRETDPLKQINEILKRFDLCSATQPMSRCTHCNGNLEDVSKAQVLDKLEPKTKKYYQDFKKCSDCGQIYWKGSHFRKLQQLIAGLVPPDSTL